MGPEASSNEWVREVLISWKELTPSVNESVTLVSKSVNESTPSDVEIVTLRVDSLPLPKCSTMSLRHGRYGHLQGYRVIEGILDKQNDSNLE